MLFREAKAMRETITKNLTEGDTSRAEQSLSSIEQKDGVIISPFSQQPLVQAMFLPLCGILSSALIEWSKQLLLRMG
jgi:hypothetical protein